MNAGKAWALRAAALAALSVACDSALAQKAPPGVPRFPEAVPEWAARPVPGLPRTDPGRGLGLIGAADRGMSASPGKGASAPPFTEGTPRYDRPGQAPDGAPGKGSSHSARGGGPGKGKSHDAHRGKSGESHGKSQETPDENLQAEADAGNSAGARALHQLPTCQ